MKITIIGMGYVGISLSILISQKHKVIGVDINQEKIKLINKKVSPISDPEVEKYLKNENLNFSATTDLKEAINDTDFFIICAQQIILLYLEHLIHQALKMLWK